MTFLSNLFFILRSAPQVIGIIKTILDIVGSTQVQKILETIRDALKMELPDKSVPPTSEAAREGLVKRLFRRMAFKNLGMTEQEYVSYCNFTNTGQKVDLA